MIGAIEAEQIERDGRQERNDRLIGVESHAHTQDHVTSLSDLRPQMVEEIEAFFEHYNRLAGKKFRPIHRSDAKSAVGLVKQGVQAYKPS